ncbi:hypothetical protein H072_7373 [Dactylellina haptotyla CBS 200.50]|uniref:Uncharacterized protein n=1 Tax=Dactylellina haptotyla (strain CBS 200.50) TaxID=1284197 RepID=S8A7C5_DACHA|nr:hypothetical protein H072_7373 [Dactylellina haptotyla CBS 200.50]
MRLPSRRGGHSLTSIVCLYLLHSRCVNGEEILLSPAEYASIFTRYNTTYIEPIINARKSLYDLGQSIYRLAWYPGQPLIVKWDPDQTPTPTVYDRITAVVKGVELAKSALKLQCHISSDWREACTDITAILDTISSSLSSMLTQKVDTDAWFWSLSQTFEFENTNIWMFVRKITSPLTLYPNTAWTVMYLLGTLKNPKTGEYNIATEKPEARISILRSVMDTLENMISVPLQETRTLDEVVAHRELESRVGELNENFVGEFEEVFRMVKAYYKELEVIANSLEGLLVAVVNEYGERED